MADEHEAHPVNYKLIFAFLCACTIFSVLADMYGKGMIGRAVLIGIVLFIAVCKALFVLLYFMHIRFEGPWKYVLLSPTLVLAMAIPFTLAPDISFHYYNMEVPQNENIPASVDDSGHGMHEAPGLPGTTGFGEHGPMNAPAPTNKH